MKTIITHPNFYWIKEEILKKSINFNDTEVNFGNFPDWWPNIFFKSPLDIKNNEIVYIADFSKPEYFFSNYSIIRALFLYQSKKIDIFIPFFPVGTMERITEIWEVATSKYFADLISMLPVWNTKTTLHIFDIHSLEQRFFFNDLNINIELHSCMGKIKKYIKNDTVIVFPDQWAKKRFFNDFKWYDITYCTKQRVWEDRKITLLDWSVTNKDVIIIDDLIQTWWTIINTAKMLRELWAKDIYAFATHWIFPNNSYLKLLDNLDKLFITNSNPYMVNNMSSCNNLNIISISDNIIEICEN